MFVKQFALGGDRNFGYLIADEPARQAAIIDPAYIPEQLVEFAKEVQYEIKYIFITHDHPDHMNGNDAIRELTGLQPLLFGATEPASGIKVSDGARFPLGGGTIEILHTPGHTKDSICLLAADMVFTGDTLFVGKVGGTYLRAAARAQYKSLHEELLKLPDDTRVFPEHDVGVQPESTIGHERQTNPFLQQPDFKSFTHLKKNWLQYKKEHGIA